MTVIWASVLYGLYHGLIYLPVMLSWFGPEPFRDAISDTNEFSPSPADHAHPDEFSFSSKVSEASPIEGRKHSIQASFPQKVPNLHLGLFRSSGKYPLDGGAAPSKSGKAGMHESPVPIVMTLQPRACRETYTARPFT
ncbi:unnamed protein product [Darwinula stevensoni]|uniref:Uncharacterized protein n=1 Tax=Darwinula stevensoni TaxID=69355 RepID=A0A7R8XEL2_9CRUS|nr:unnamed protein product [Darwinula stevensoni]CAG0894339.1 unnamed protein product [Darwinula stevensoni]